MVADEDLLDSGAPKHDANDTEYEAKIVWLCLAGTELIFFTAGPKVLHFSFVTKTVLTAC